MQYLALTIGPIYRTLQQARKTRELWAASYMFARLMERLVQNITEKGGVVIKPKQIEINPDQLFGAGIYPDRLYAKADALDEKKVENAIQLAVTGLATDMLHNGVNAENDLFEYWRNYFRIEWVLKALTPVESKKFTTELSPYLDTLELQEPYFSEQPAKQYLLEFWKNPYGCKIADVLKGEGKGVYKGLLERNQCFPTTADFSTFELYQKNETKQAYLDIFIKAEEKANKIEEEKAIREDKEFNGLEPESDETLSQFFIMLYETDDAVLKKHRRDYHKYFCIVHADGDNLGKALEQMDDVVKQGDFAVALAEFRAEAAGIINGFGGKPVYIGGDDMLFFAPVRTASGSIFQLVKDLNHAFNERIEGLELGSIKHPTLSFGITITYHKFPLFEAVEMSREQLDERAKQYKTTSTEKDAVAFRLLKHSGSYFEAILTKDQLYRFLDTDSQLNALNTDLISSVVYKLDVLEKLMEKLVVNGQIPADRLENLFYNFFNERIHRQHQTQMDLIREFVASVYNQTANVDGKTLNLNDNLYAVLRFLNFINEK